MKEDEDKQDKNSIKRVLITKDSIVALKAFATILLFWFYKSEKAVCERIDYHLRIEI